MIPIQDKPIRLNGDVLTPATPGHNITAKVQLEEELVNQAADTRVLENVQSDRQLYVRVVNVQLEADKILRSSCCCIVNNIFRER